MAGQPFIAFEWGSEVVYALAYRAAGLAGVAVLAGLVLALTYALVSRFLIRRGGDPLLAYFMSMAAAVLSAAHWLARPHLFTMLAVVLLLELLETPRPANPVAVLSRSSWSGPTCTAVSSTGASRSPSTRWGSCSRRGSRPGRTARSGSPAHATTRPRWASRW